MFEVVEWVADKVLSFFAGLLITLIFVIVLISIGIAGAWIVDQVKGIKTLEDIVKGLIVILVGAGSIFMIWYMGHSWRHDKI